MVHPHPHPNPYPNPNPNPNPNRNEAAYKLVKNHAAVAAFAARAAGEPGEKRFQAPLADPYARPGKEALPAVGVCSEPSLSLSLSLSLSP